MKVFSALRGMDIICEYKPTGKTRLRKPSRKKRW